MKKLGKISAILLPFLLFITGVIYWFEADKEVRILCGLFNEGQSSQEIIRTLETGNLLMYSSGPRMIYVDSFYTLATSSCTISLNEDSSVISAVYEQSFHLERVAAWTGFCLTILLIGFQLLLASGLPFGEYAWGGKHRILPKNLRIGSGISALILVLIAVSALSAIEVTGLLTGPLAHYVVYLATLAFLFSTIGNMLSSSTKERKIMIPVSIVLFCSYFILSVSLM